MAQCHGAWDSESSRWAGDGMGSKGEERSVRDWTRAHLSGRTHAEISARDVRRCVESTRDGLRRERGSLPACLLSVSLFESHSAESRDLGMAGAEAAALSALSSRNARTHQHARGQAWRRCTRAKSEVTGVAVACETPGVLSTSATCDSGEACLTESPDAETRRTDVRDGESLTLSWRCWWSEGWKQQGCSRKADAGEASASASACASAPVAVPAAR